MRVNTVPRRFRSPFPPDFTNNEIRFSLHFVCWFSGAEAAGAATSLKDMQQLLNSPDYVSLFVVEIRFCQLNKIGQRVFFW